jgi:hypothetical protein
MKKSSTRSKRMKKQSRRSRKTRGGYNKAIETKRSRYYPFEKHLYSVEFTEEEKEKIKDYKKKYQNAGGADILKALFPDMEENYKSDAIYKIQVLTRMTGHDR